MSTILKFAMDSVQRFSLAVPLTSKFVADPFLGLGTLTTCCRAYTKGTPLGPFRLYKNTL